MTAESLYEAYRAESMRKGGVRPRWDQLGEYERECWHAVVSATDADRGRLQSCT